ncbi:hypothetical protein IDM48_03845 [Rothia amarae]|uniref:General stress protein 17M-like domain-containing protein n=1 Tax=Rothia amarae TaxID=169480 RepID=A0A7H2BLK3_9MICC|nr:general stress protein [Rothia amarae]QNV40549.1 hypothetical protein IDM48_03845 [Rothia amarae]
MNEQQITPVIPEAGKIPRGELVQNFTSRAELDAAMGRLTSAGLPAQAFFVVGHDLKQVEYFIGKLSYPRIALSSALSGATFGALIGVVTALVTGTSVLPHLASAVPLGIAIWMIFGILSFSRGNKNGAFQMRQQMIPTAFSLMSNPSVAAQAREVLGVRSQNFRPQLAHPNTPASGTPSSVVQGHSHEQADPTTFVGPEYNRDGSPAGGKFGLRIDDPEEYAKMVRTEPMRPDDSEQRIEKVREEQSPQRYGLKVEDSQEVQDSVRNAPASSAPEEPSEHHGSRKS